MPVSSWPSERRPARWLAAAALALALPLQAVPGTATAARLPGADWDLSLPTLDGRRFVRLSEQPGPVLVNFWSVDCPPCVAELPTLVEFARRHPPWRVLLVSTDPPALVRDFLGRQGLELPASVLVLRGDGRARSLLSEAGARQGALPHSVGWLPARSCHVHAGMLGPAQLVTLLDRCQRDPAG